MSSDVYNRFIISDQIIELALKKNLENKAVYRSKGRIIRIEVEFGTIYISYEIILFYYVR
jgi:hypothetical protein